MISLQALSMVDVLTIIVLPSLCRPQINEDSMSMALNSGQLPSMLSDPFSKVE